MTYLDQAVRLIARADITLAKFNPNHDPKTGEFTSGSGGAAPAAATTTEVVVPKIIPPGLVGGLVPSVISLVGTQPPVVAKPPGDVGKPKDKIPRLKPKDVPEGHTEKLDELVAQWKIISGRLKTSIWRIGRQQAKPAAKALKSFESAQKHLKAGRVTQAAKAIKAGNKAAGMTLAGGFAEMGPLGLPARIPGTPSLPHTAAGHAERVGRLAQVRYGPMPVQKFWQELAKRDTTWLKHVRF